MADAEDSNDGGGAGCLTAIAIFVILVIVGAIFGPDEEQAGTEQSPTASSAVTTESASTTSTVPLPPRVDDLPIVAAGSEASEVLVLQRLLNATCCSVAEDGSWGPQTEDALNQLRASVGLPAGTSLDAALWRRVLELPPPERLSKKEALEGLLIPANAVFLDEEVPGSNPSARARYILPFSADPKAVSNAVTQWNGQSGVDGWRWCESYSAGDVATARFWWQRSGRTLSLVVRDKALGRVEISLMVEEGTDISGCDGATPSISDLEVNSSGSYRYRNEIAGWAWRPVAEYRNDGEFAITYLRVRWTMTGPYRYRIHYTDVVQTRIGPGKSIEVMPGDWFFLNGFDSDQQELGLLLGSSQLSVSSTVEYIEFEDGTRVGVP